jgi:hypothetical protein
MEALISLFKDQFVSWEAGKIWAVLRDGLGWLAGLIYIALSHNLGYSVHVLLLIFRSSIVCMRWDQYS